ncbi:MAG: acyl-CoA dehydrogenase [Thermoanaerobaculia bacterium]
MTYQADLRDLKFQIFEWLPGDELLAAERFADWDRDSVEMVLDEAGTIAREVFAPANEDGDRVGARWQDGRVTTPDSFKTAYRALTEGGWVGSTANPEFGGLGLPDVVGAAINEVFIGANMSFSLTTLLTRGTAGLIDHFGTEELRRRMCEPMVSGRWTGTMCLTEPQAGSDVGASTAEAVKQDDGSYLLRGDKIFITAGEHDLTENIIHAVLARTPGAPPGTRGLSLFIVPKIRIEDDGSLGEANDVVCTGIEHKMGIHGSPTCSISFGPDGACKAYLLGEEGDGMQVMFHMMNAARIEVGVQGAAIAAAAHQAALAYAKERLQMRHWNKAAGHGNAQVPIIEHPDVRRMLLSSAAYVQAMRALLLKTAYYLDKSHGGDGEDADRYDGFVEVLTPICKAWASDWGFRVTEWSLQVFGGYGYTRDYPAEQYVRDSKITSIYEGTNGIQALDFVGRKLRLQGGAPVRELLAMAAATAAAVGSDEELAEPARLLGEAVGQIGEIVGEVVGRDDAALLMMLNAVPLLDMFGTVFGAQCLLEQAAVARRRLGKIYAERGVDSDEEARREFLEDNAEAAHYHNKVQAAVHFCYRALPGVTAQGVAIRAGEKAPMEAVF